MRCDRRQHRHLQRSRIVGAGKFNDAAVDLADREIDLPRQRPAQRGQFKPPCKTLEQGDAELFLQPTDAVTDRALREVQLARSLREAEMPRGHDEYPQRIKRWSTGHVLNGGRWRLDMDAEPTRSIHEVCSRA